MRKNRKNILIKVKRLKNSYELPLPQKATPHSSGVDLYAAVEQSILLNSGEIKLVPTGLIIEIPPGYEAQIRPRSGLALKHGIGVLNSPGTIDSDYRGEVGVILFNFSQTSFEIKRGDRIAQMVIAKTVDFKLHETKQVTKTKRGSGGFGHTGIK